MIKVLPYSQFGQIPHQLLPILKKFDLSIVQSNPDVIITYGGDGTLIGAERDYPGIPKLPLKNTQVGYHTIPLDTKQTLQLFLNNQLVLKEFFKLEASFNSQKLLVLNEVTIRNTLPNSAIRFQVTSTPHLATSNSELIGDGLVVSTPFGSSGYFYSITHQTFTQGIGLAFNNIHNINIAHQILPESSIVTTTILRGPATLATDNSPTFFNLADTTEVLIKKSTHLARIFTAPPLS